MKKLLATLLLVLFPVMGVLAQDNGNSGLPINVDASVFLSYGVFDTSDAGEYEDAVGIMLTLLTIRGGVSGTVRYEFSDMISAGVELGLASMSIDLGGGEVTFIDIPMNVVARFGFDSLFVEPHVGYYATIGSDLGGLTLGAKLGLGSWFIDASLVSGTISYSRFTLGYQLNNLL